MKRLIIGSMRTYKGFITKLEPNQVFVFGSNTQGRHGKGAALWALKNAEAVYGQRYGLQGQSFAIVTKDLTKRIHPSIKSKDIIYQIKIFYRIANENPDKEYLIAYSGTGNNLNGYSNQEMADMFASFPIPDNIVFEETFSKLIKELE